MRTNAHAVDLAVRMRQAITALDARARAERGGELPLTQVSVLGRVASQGPITPGELGAQLRMLPQSLTRPLSRLERSGLIRRTRDPTDGRSALLEVTDAGRATLQAEFAPLTRWLAAAVTAVCTDDDRAILEQATAVMQRLAEHGGVVPREP